MGGASIGLNDRAENSQNGRVRIEGGSVVARGGSAHDGTGGSAGIGGSYGSILPSESDGGGKANVVITGGNVTATGGAYAAAIGGGTCGSGGVSIEGGTVTANAGTGGSAIGCGYNYDINTGSYAYIKQATVCANGNTGHPKNGTYGTDDFSMYFDDTYGATVYCTGEVTSSRATNHEFSFTVYDGSLAPGTYDCAFWTDGEPLNNGSAAHANAGTLTVTEAGIATVTVKRIVQYDSLDSASVIGHLKVGDKTFSTTAAAINKVTAKQKLYSGYRVTLTGTVYDAAIASGQVGTVSVDGVDLASQSVSTSASKAVVSAVFYFEEGEAADQDDLTKFANGADVYINSM